MSTLREFPTWVHESLASYVYLLTDDNDRPFYVGKGTGNRIFDHLRAAENSTGEGEKLERIRELADRVRCVILRHGLSDKEAREVESAFIDFLGLDELTNLVQGLDANIRGLMSTEELVAAYQAPPATIHEPAILINIRHRWRRGMAKAELYEATRNSWSVAPERHGAKYAFAIAKAIVRQVFSVTRWYRPANAPDRWAFEGAVAIELAHYVGSNVLTYYTPGARNPIRYINC